MRSQGVGLIKGHLIRCMEGVLEEHGEGWDGWDGVVVAEVRAEVGCKGAGAIVTGRRSWLCSQADWSAEPRVRIPTARYHLHKPKLDIKLEIMCVSHGGCLCIYISLVHETAFVIVYGNYNKERNGAIYICSIFNEMSMRDCSKVRQVHINNESMLSR